MVLVAIFVLYVTPFIGLLNSVQTFTRVSGYYIQWRIWEGARDAPPLQGQNVFIFKQFSRKIGQVCWRPPLGSPGSATDIPLRNKIAGKLKDVKKRVINQCMDSNERRSGRIFIKRQENQPGDKVVSVV